MSAESSGIYGAGMSRNASRYLSAAQAFVLLEPGQRCGLYIGKLEHQTSLKHAHVLLPA